MGKREMKRENCKEMKEIEAEWIGETEIGDRQR